MTPVGGAFGCFQKVVFYSNANETGRIVTTSYDFVNGGSQSYFATNGAFGCFEVVLRTNGYNSNGSINQIIFNFASGVSRTITPVVGDSAHETDVFTSGIDSTGSVLASAIVPAGTAAEVFAFATGSTLLSPAAASDQAGKSFSQVLVNKIGATSQQVQDAGLTKMTLADLSATPGSVAAMLVTSHSGAGATIPVPQPPGIADVAAHLAQVAAPPLMAHQTH